MNGRRVLFGLLLAAAFGVAAGLFKGDETGLRAGIGNLSAPWLLVALLPAVNCRTVPRGALMGFTSTLVALTGFYAALTAVLAGHLGGGGYFTEFLVEAQANRLYFLGGFVTGPLLGAAGAWIGRSRPRSLWPVVGALVAGEILVVALVQGRQLLPPPLFFLWAVDDWTPYIGESAVGIAIVLVALWRTRSKAPPDSPTRAPVAQASPRQVSEAD
ncbi:MULTISPECIES: hypothetical protein [unclassified Microbispora]|uniref:hypothetical protein n=1 Tax=unclassified Microbispora TaxID=2614687 RepID=UPI0014734E06|nr:MULTISPECIES: hypothetical protein [unclassified Microbispora]